MSSVKAGRPVTSLTPSTLRAFVPTTELLLMAHLDQVRCSGRDQHGLHRLAVSGAAAIVAGQGFAHLLFGGVGAAIQQRLGGKQHAARAESTLHRAGVKERLLK